MLCPPLSVQMPMRVPPFECQPVDKVFRKARTQRRGDFG